MSKLKESSIIFDFELYQKMAEYDRKKEEEYWKYVLSGQRTIDLFGEEGAKIVLEEQSKRDRELYGTD